MIDLDNILQMRGLQPELRRAFGKLGSLAIPFGTPVNAAAAKVELLAADLAIMANGDTVTFEGVELEKAAAPGPAAWDDADALAGLLGTIPGWDAANDNGKVTITGATRGAWGNGNEATITVLEDATAGGDGAGTAATATIAKATIDQLAIGDTVEFAGEVFTMATDNSVQDNKFKNLAGLIACIDAMDDWTAVGNAGAVDIEAATDSTDFNGVEIIVTLKRVTAGGVDGTPGFQGAVCCDAGFIYVCTATDTTILNNNWERVAIAGGF
jgi:hypothetical protein